MDAPRISPREARDAVERGGALLVDVRNSIVFREAHAEGAEFFPVKSGVVGTLPKDKLLIFY